jgi:hypothetical protein
MILSAGWTLKGGRLLRGALKQVTRTSETGGLSTDLRPHSFRSRSLVTRRYPMEQECVRFRAKSEQRESGRVSDCKQSDNSYLYSG